MATDQHMIFITCPTTQQPTPTGMVIPNKDFGVSLCGNSVQCAHCGQMHKWDGEDGYYSGEPQKSAPGSN